MPTIYCEDITNTTGLLSLERVISKKKQHIRNQGVCVEGWLGIIFHRQKQFFVVNTKRCVV